MTKIYLVENCYGDNNKVYIGKTKNTRYHPHKRKFGDGIKYTIIDSIDSLNVIDWKFLEIYWIEQFRQWGFSIMNGNSGGGGCSFHSEVSKLKMKKPKYNKENYSYPKTQSFIDSVTGKSKSHPTSRNGKISKSLKGYKQSKEHIKKRTIKLIGKSNLKNKKPKPLGFGKNISEKLKGRSREDIKKKILQYDIENNFIKEWPSIMDACIFLYNDPSKNPNITSCCKGRIKHAYGFIWKYKL